MATSQIILKQIPISQLKTGVYLHDLNLKLSLLPAIKSRAKIPTHFTNNILQNIINTGIQTVAIDTVKGRDVDEAYLVSTKHKIVIRHSPKKSLTLAATLPEIEASSLKEELKTAKSLRHRSIQTINNVFIDANKSFKINTDEIKTTVE
ncbi:MAG: DUF3391 domain-containing protein [Gammaproteobacteria bacterium]|nr:DUF3391 domain-containing protein [Gammaproteobacteria bacterium]